MRFSVRGMAEPTVCSVALAPHVKFAKRIATDLLLLWCLLCACWCAGFTGDFWRAYHEVIPKAPGFDRRKDLYLLYHYLNHTNLFGGGYYNTSLRIMERLVQQL